MSGESDPPKVDADPIDAEYEEPTRSSADYVAHADSSHRKGPGWGALGLTGVLAAVIGTGAGVFLEGRVGQAFAPESLSGEVQTLIEAQAQAKTDLISLTEEIERTETRLNRQIDAAMAGRGDEEAVVSLVEQVTALTAQLDALEANGYETADADGTQSDQLLARIEALEILDEGEVVSPRLANRAIQSVQRRVEEIEADLATRRDVIGDFDSRIETLEQSSDNLETIGALEAVDGLRAELYALRQSMGELDKRDPSEDIADLRAQIADLREGEVANSEALTERTAGQTATVSILSIEAAARDGRPFQTAYARLEQALPGNRSLTKLKALANTGAPTLASLQNDFATARLIAEKRMAQTDNSSGDNWSWVRQALGEAVIVRRSGEGVAAIPAQAGSFEAVMDAAELRLAVGDLKGAIGAIQTLDDRLRQPFANWLTEAGTRQTLEDGLDELRLTLMDAGQ